jgi:hypothetical protein
VHIASLQSVNRPRRGEEGLEFSMSLPVLGFACMFARVSELTTTGITRNKQGRLSSVTGCQVSTYVLRTWWVSVCRSCQTCHLCRRQWQECFLAPLARSARCMITLPVSWPAAEEDSRCGACRNISY